MTFSFLQCGQEAIVGVCDKRIEAWVVVQRGKIGVFAHIACVPREKAMVNGFPQQGKRFHSLALM